METTSTVLEQAIGLLESVARVRVDGLTDAEVCSFAERVETAGRLVDAARVLAASEIDARSAYGFGQDGLAQRNGHAKGVHFVEQLTLVCQAEATRRIRLGSAIRPSAHLGGQAAQPEFPALAAAVTSGAVGVDSAAHIIRCLQDAAKTAGAADVAIAEQTLVERAVVDSADLVRQHALVAREVLDPDGAEPRDERLHRRRGVVVGRERDGLSTITMTADGVGRAPLVSLFDEGCGPRVVPRFLSDEDRASGTTTEVTREGSITEVLVDPRTRAQKQYDVLMGTLTAGVRSVGVHHAHPRVAEMLPSEMRSTATVTAVVQLDDLLAGAGVGWLDGVTEPVSAARIRELACDAGFETLVLGEHGEALYLERTVAMFTAAQRRAMAVRDGGCVWPGCDAPPGRTEAHHVIERVNRGKTDIDNGTLLCAAHHHFLHDSAYLMTMIRGRPHLLAPPWIDPHQTWRALGVNRVTLIPRPRRA